MGGGNDNQGKSPTYGSTPGANPSGNDPRGNVQNQILYQQDRFNKQQGPLAAATMYNYGRGSEANYGDYTDIMNNYRDIYSGGGAGGGGTGGGGGGGGIGGQEVFDASGMFTPFHAGYSDPFNSYAGFQEFSNTGGYSAADIANMRARGVSPIRAAYANAQSEIQRQRALQGGYSPNAIASQVRMAREQGQSAADTVTNVEAGLAQARNQGRLSGLGGMSNIEGQRLAADVDVSKFNAGADTTAQARNIAAAQQAAQERTSNARASAAAAAASSAASMNDRFRALGGATQLYGTTPGMAATFGNQALSAVGMGSQFGQGMVNAQANAGRLPGAFDQFGNRVDQAFDWAGKAGSAIYPWLNRGNQNPQARDTGPYQWQGPVNQQPYGPEDYPYQGPQDQPDYYPGEDQGNIWY